MGQLFESAKLFLPKATGGRKKWPNSTFWQQADRRSARAETALNAPAWPRHRAWPVSGYGV